MTTAPDTPWQHRYRTPSDTARAANPVIDALLDHRSVRRYLTTPLPENTLATLVAAAQSASSSSNLQAWSVLAVQDPPRKARLSAIASDQEHIRQAPLFLVWLADFSRAQRIADTRAIELQAPAYLDSLLLGSIDAALAAQNAVVAAESLGLGTVYIGALRNNVQAVIDELQLPPLVFPVFGLCVGYPDPQAPAAIKPRLGQDVVLHHETYQVDDAEPQRIAAYEQVAADFSREQGQVSGKWGEQVVQRLRDKGSLHGREILAEVLRKQGLGLY
ncbi:NADPH-dependent oxidoreductase [Pseudomonas sp. MWU16-30317]|uniref:NADPH-dependent oxidoreductase n=1 Tax=Pseudomonas sp. MWU16-30317 TaxID=2878095 RepID=UPI001CFA786E|nr:NADPH-dependent oxidoreductase [Pseudomonas sp. MWU16-30317]